MSHVIQKKSSVLPLVGGVVPILLILLFSFSAEARPGPRSVHLLSKEVLQWSNFFDPEFAKNTVDKVMTFEELDNISADWNAYSQWEKESVNRPVAESMKALEKYPNKEGIKRAHDIQHLWEWWSFTFSSVTRPVKAPHYSWKGWNKWGEKQCNVIKRRLSQSMKEPCIIPDWRSPEMVAEDEAFLKKAALKAKK